MEKTVLVLEPSTNTHKMEGKVKISAELSELKGIVLVTEGQCMVFHGEHGVIVTEEQNVIKLIQQELNPLTKKMMNSID